MSELLPLFPLQLVVFPGESLNLHIFEPRYKQLIGECEERGTTFGIPAYIDGKVQNIGTEIELVSIEKKYPKGEMDVKTKGTGIFKIHDFQQQASGKLYPGGRIERIPFTTEGDLLKNKKILELAAELFNLLQVNKEPPSDPAAFSTFDIAHQVGFTLQQEYQFLAIPEEALRQDVMLQQLGQLLPTVRKMNEVREKIQMNGHFKDIIPPEL